MKDTKHECVERLVVKFFKGSHNIKLNQDDLNSLTWSGQENFLDQTINSSIFKKYPSNRNFCVLFFKKLIQFLEPAQEVHDDMYKFLCSVLKNGNDNEFCYRHYIVKDDLSNIITIKETNNIVVNGTTGLRTWEAGIMLSDWALSSPQTFSNKKIVELGSGVGLTGITITKHCQVESMIMTDCHTEVLRTIINNVEINFPEAICEQHKDITLYINKGKVVGARILDWYDADELLASNLVPDVVIGADIVYDPSILRPLVNVFKIFHEKNNNVDIFIASVIRNEETFKEFLNVLESSNFIYETLPLTKNGYLDWDETINRCLIKINKL